MAEVREREEKPLSKTLWVIYQTVSHTCGPQSSAKTPTHNYHTSNMSPFNPFKNFFGTKTLFCSTSNHLFGRDEYYKHVFMRVKKVLGIR